ncbi:MAG: type I restriction enzyme HsdR N-terminal domain-containing protein [Bacteroidota bacterium]
MLELSLSDYQSHLRIKKQANKRYLWDEIRAKWLVLQPEELVRQLLIHYLLNQHQVSKNRIAIERGIKVNQLQKRCDILIYDQAMNPWLLVECKAPSVKLNQAVFRQIATYNMPLQVPYLLVCNGPHAYCCAIDFAEQTFIFLEELPVYE